MSSFLYDGNRINEDDTPTSLEMEDNGKSIFFSRNECKLTPIADTIDVMVERKASPSLSSFSFLTNFDLLIPSMQRSEGQHYLYNNIIAANSCTSYKHSPYISFSFHTNRYGGQMLIAAVARYPVDFSF